MFYIRLKNFYLLDYILTDIAKRYTNLAVSKSISLELTLEQMKLKLYQASIEITKIQFPIDHVTQTFSFSPTCYNR